MEYCSANNSGAGIRIAPGTDNNSLDLLALDLSKNTSGMILRGNLIRVWGGTFEGNGSQSGAPAGYGISVPDDSASHGVHVHDPYFEDNTQANVYFGAAAGFCHYLSAMGGDALPLVDRQSNSIGTYVMGDPRINLAEVRHTNTKGRSIRLLPGAALPVNAVSCDGPSDNEVLALYGKGAGGIAFGFYGSPVQGLWTSDDNPYPAKSPRHHMPAETLAPGEYRSITVPISNNHYGAHPKLGDLAVASYSQSLPEGVTISAAVTSDDLATVSIVNNSRLPAAVPDGYVRVAVIVI